LRRRNLEGKEKDLGRAYRRTETEAREAGVFVVPLLQKILKKYKENLPAGVEGWIFRGEKSMRPLDLDNLSGRDIPQYINGAWFG